jgi:hypothetical protein
VQASKEIKQWINHACKVMGKKNGVVPFLWEDYLMENMMFTSKKNYKRNKRINIEETI